MKKRLNFLMIAICAIGVLGLTECSTHRERYEDPPWLGGSSIEILEEEGNYTSFLALMEKANYKEPISKQLFTLFVPDDEAFEAYFEKAGISSVDEMTKDEAVQLFTLHVLQNPRSRFYLIYEYVWNEFQGPDQGQEGEYMSLFHRKKTPSTTTPYTETIRYFEDMVGQEVLMKSGEKFVPLFTDEWFHDYGSFDAAGDYQFMYPESQWKVGYEPEMPGTNWHSAMVLPHVNAANEVELEVRSASGFLYFIDRVVEPMPSMDEYLQKTEKYSLYYDILQRFATFSSDGSTPDGKALYKKSYDLVNDIADETSNSAEGNFPQYMWSGMIPSNNVLQNYLDNNILVHYSSLDDVPRVTLYYLVQSQLSNDLVLMSKMENSFFNAFGDQMEMSREDLEPGYMCSNGVVYESKKVIEPSVFTTVPRPLFFDEDYSTLLYIMSEAEELVNLSDSEKKVTLFASNNEQLEEYGIRYLDESVGVEFRSPATGQWKKMIEQDLIDFAQNQIVMGEYSDFSGNGFIQTSSGTYMNFSNNKVMASENQHKDQIGTVLDVEKNDINGYLVKVDKPLESRYTMGQFFADNNSVRPQANYNDISPYNDDISIFFLMMRDLALVSNDIMIVDTREAICRIQFLPYADYWTAFVPTNAAMQQAISEGIIPDVTVANWKRNLSSGALDSLTNWVHYHFIVGDVVLADGSTSGEFHTHFTYYGEDGKTKLNTPITINNDSNNLTITDATGNVTTINEENDNFLVKEGVVHKLDSVLKLYE